MANATQPSDDFFSLLEKEQKESGPIKDEIIFRDQTGQMKVLKGGQIFDYAQKPPAQAEKPAPLKPILASKPAAAPKILPTPPAKPISPPSQPIKTQAVSFEDRLPAAPLAPLNASAFRQPSGFDQSFSVADYQQAAVAVINSAGITLTDSDLAKRLKNIIVSNLRNIRDRMETREMLIASALSGGVGLDGSVAAKLIEAAEKKHEELVGGGPKIMPIKDLQKEAEEILVPAPAMPKAALEKPLMPSPELPKSQTPPKPQTPPKIEVPKPIALPVMPLKPVVPDIPVRIQAPKPLPKPEPIIKNREIITEPVKFSPKLLDPIEEIRTMSLADFRLLDQDPIKATEAIVKRIDLLDEESLVQKVKGINAWKQSEPYRLYLALGLQAMEEKRSMDDIMAEKQSAGQMTLTQAELEAIMELNFKLRY